MTAAYYRAGVRLWVAYTCVVYLFLLLILKSNILQESESWRAEMCADKMEVPEVIPMWDKCVLLV